jgi:putative acetyltransferase
MQIKPGIHPVAAADIPRLVEVWEASVRATHDFLSESDIQFFKPAVREELYGALDLACVRDAGGRLAGFVGVAEGKVEALFIHPGLRGRGAGRTLLEHAVATLGATRVDVNEQNDQAVGFYRRMGFEVEGRSALDSTGKPFPLLHMRLWPTASGG